MADNYNASMTFGAGAQVCAPQGMAIHNHAKVGSNGSFGPAIGEFVESNADRASITKATANQPALQLHPNPTSERVRVQVSGKGLQPRGIKVSDLPGRSVLSLPFTEVGGALDISALVPGLYTVAVHLSPFASAQGETVLRQRLVQR